MSEERSQTAYREGGCLCGAVRFRAQVLTNEVGVCHCHMCQKWSGGISMMVAVDPQLVETGIKKISAYPSSEWGERLYCADCGSSLGWRMRDGSSTNLSPAVFDDVDGFVLATEIYIDEKPEFYDLDNKARKVTGAEFLAYIAKQGVDHG